MSARAQQLLAELRKIPLEMIPSGRRTTAGAYVDLVLLEAIAEHIVDELGWIPPEQYLNLEAAVLALEGAVDRVRRLHDQDESLIARGTWCPADGQPEPCKTIQALNGRAPT